MTTRQISPCGPISGAVRVPGSKSITNRALLIAALAEGKSVLSGALDSEDTRIMFDALKQLGLQLDWDKENCRIQIEGLAGNFPNREGEIYVGNSGTTARFLTAGLALSNGSYRIYGKPRMHERPIADLIAALNLLGGNVRSENGSGCPPVLIRGTGSLHGTAQVPANVSSQFFSGLLMAAGASKDKIDLEIDGDLVSRPYIEMTLAVMESFGVKVDVDPAFQHFSGFEKTNYLGTGYEIEPDASAASYMFAIPAIVGGSVSVLGFSKSCIQGDIRFVERLAQMGCHVILEDDRITVERAVNPDGSLAPLRGIITDMNDISDTVQTLSVVALFANGTTEIRNVKHIRYKETDRISAAAAELRKLGATVDEFEDGLRIQGNRLDSLHGALIDTYDDHRMAMSLSLAGLRIPGVEIQNPDCTQKTWPNYFNDLEAAVHPKK
ncbi:MAG: 3-phosphoshikimate 1-carboxyvinyltransferase [Planctomycetia bacterium]|nr:3-phosphoshikimate 1-carboxyvinyltransferase [Planctomycetia bacterium]